MFKTLETFDTEYSADSVEWCPADDFQDIFVCGTYQLAADDRKELDVKGTEKKYRVGRIYLFQVVKDNNVQLKLLQKFDDAAILDMKWAHKKCFDGKILLGVVNAEGYLLIYQLIKELEKVYLKIISKILVNNVESSVLALSLDWSTAKMPEDDLTEIKITVSDSQGSVSLFRLCNSANDIEKVCTWQAHEFEAWIAVFDCWDTNVIYTGGDDCKFLRFDTRINTSNPTHTNRCHNAGVTSLHCNWKKEYFLLSGSYDETLRTWDSRNFRRPIAEVCLNGGIWRLKWDPYRCKYLLAACMYNGFFILDCDNLEHPDIIAEYKEHESIAYGCDWSHLNNQFNLMENILGEKNSALVGTCSFYDHTLKLSSIKLEELEIM